MSASQRKSKLSLIAAMVIFGTIGIIRRRINLPSSLIALVRAMVGTVFLLGIILFRRQKPNWAAICKNAPALILSGAALGFNWVLLFESYRYTSVATATLCYYMAPILVILVSPLLKEKLTGGKLLCVAAALVGTVLVSGVWDTGGITGGTGIAFGLGAAALYAAVMLLNKTISLTSAYDKTIVQLAVAGLVLLPYTFLTEDVSGGLATAGSAMFFWLAVAGIVHTGAAYALYFGSIRALPAQTAALYSYIDPIVAIVLSAAVLGEPMTVSAAVGAALILGAAVVSDKI